VLSDFLSAGGVPGDYNEDGIVGAADYVVWRNNLGSGTSLPNDDTAGVGLDDYTRWSTNFGAVGPGGGASIVSASAPEPVSLTLLGFGLGLLFFVRRRG
jgi:hypothetical protein